MDVERGAISRYIVSARQLTGETHYLFVFQKKDRPTFYQYSITTNVGASSLLVLEIEEVDNATATDGEVTLEAGDWGVSVYAQGNGTNLDAAEATRLIHTEMVRVYSDTDETPVYPPAGGVCEGVDILDGEGNVIAHVNDGDTYTVDEVPYLAAIYATEAAALLDTTTIPTNVQAIKVAGRLYQGDGSKNAKQLVEAMVYNPTVTEDGTHPWTTVVGDKQFEIQLNAL